MSCNYSIVLGFNAFIRKPIGNYLSKTLISFRASSFDRVKTYLKETFF